MTFLQPYILWGLPLILVPVIIHLINRLRHRPQPWAAMMFLVSASRSSTSHAKLRQWLILLFRVLAVLMLVLFVSRPLAGGWLGWAVSAAPDNVLILLDRSASMEAKLSGNTVTKREQTLKLLAQAARAFESSSHLLLIDSALRAPQRIASADALNHLTLTEPTDTAADLPAMMQTALNWLIENKSGTAEIWIATDLQRSNWQPADDRWKNLSAQLTALQQRTRVRLLTFNEADSADARVSIADVFRRQNGALAELQLSLDIQRTANTTETVPLIVTLNGVRSQYEIPIEGQSVRWRQSLPLGEKSGGGWGSVQLPADANLRNNTAYFVYGGATTLKTIVVSADKANGRFLKLAASAAALGAAKSVTVVPPDEFEKLSLDEQSLVLWQASLPRGAAERQLQQFIESGGAVVFFPSGQTDASKFQGIGWGAVQTAANEKSFRIERWEEKDGPLAKSDQGFSLPLNETVFLKRQQITGSADSLASFDDGTPFVARLPLGKGRLFFCATLPQPDWSSLGDGPVLVPMVQRALQSGSRRLTQTSMLTCGELSAVDAARQWTSVDATSKRIQTEAGVYRSGERLIALNRPASEDEREVLSPADARGLFGPLSVQMLEESHSRNDRLQGEVWRLFLFAMLIFLIVEGILILPNRSEKEVANRTAAEPSPEAA